jgi:hypothetical protein
LQPCWRNTPCLIEESRVTPQAYAVFVFGLASLAEAYQTQAAWLYVIGALAWALLPIAALMAWWSLRGIRLVLDAPGWVTTDDGVTLRFGLTAADTQDLDLCQVLVAEHRHLTWIGWWRARLIPYGWCLAEGSGAERIASVTFVQRGLQRVPSVRLQSAYPLALVSLSRLVTPTEPILVVPAPDPVSAMPWFNRLGGQAGAEPANALSGHQIPRGVRAYGSGDALRDIHWRVSARLGRLHTKEADDAASACVTLYLDMRRLGLEQSVHEHLVRVAATLYAAWRQMGHPVILVTQASAIPDLASYGNLADHAFLALVHPSDDAQAPDCERSAYLLSADAACVTIVDAGHFIYCPGDGRGIAGAAIVCPVGAPPGVSLEGASDA